jgi:hypothetical protein
MRIRVRIRARTMGRSRALRREIDAERATWSVKTGGLTLADGTGDLDADRDSVHCLGQFDAGSGLFAEIHLDPVAAIDPGDSDANDHPQAAEDLHHLFLGSPSVVK